MFCKYCGHLIDDDVIVCPKCGKQVQNLKPMNALNFDGFGDITQPKRKMISILLCCLGFIWIGGLHKFYEGKIALGVLYIVTCGLFFIGTIVDLINLIQKPEIYTV